MASLGHIAVGIASARLQSPTARPSWKAIAGWSALAMLPDADVVGFSMGVKYADPWGHRGAAHSLLLALAAAAGVAAAAPSLGLPRKRTWLLASAVLVSHGLLDTMTDGGLGIALLWPFDLTRYFAPWRPIPVSPIGLEFLSSYGFFVAMTELALFAPLIAYAVGRPKLGWGFLSAWAVTAWLVTSTDPVRERLMSAALREDTQFAGGFSEEAFRAVAPGQPVDGMRQRLGEPLEQAWFYFAVEDEPDPARMPPCPALFIEGDRVATPPGRRGPAVERCERAGVHVGMPVADVTRMFGPPVGMCWSYSRSPSRSYFRARVVCFESGKVFDVMRRWERGPTG
jgi:inner membrane protein